MLWQEKSPSGILAEGPMAVEPIALSSILGAPVYDSSGFLAGRVREVAISPQYDSSRVSDLVVKTRDGDRLLPLKSISLLEARMERPSHPVADWPPLVSYEGLLLLEHHLLDQQIIAVDGRKVVLVNEVDLRIEPC